MTKPEITYADFAKADIRLGRVVAVVEGGEVF